MKCVVLLALLPAVFGCGGDLSGASGTFTSPNHPADYPNNANCDWVITVAAGKRVQLTFSTFEMEDNSGGSCNYDYVDVYTDSSTRGGRYCGMNLPPVTTSTGNVMRVVLNTDDSLAYPGFSASWKEVDNSGSTPTPNPGTSSTTKAPPSACGGDYNDDTGTLTSPNYPNNYDSGMNCEYTITIATGAVRLNVEFMDIEASSGCDYDYLEIRDGSATGTVLKKLCGAGASSVISTGSAVHLKFVSDSSVNGGGFRLTWAEMTCEIAGGSCGATCDHGEFNYGCDLGLKCCKPDIFPEVCGDPPVHKPRQRIVGGDESMEHWWPWQVSLQDGTWHFCGGTLIAPQWVITAAHCVDDGAPFTVVVGEHDRESSSGKEQRIPTQKVIWHEHYTSGAPYPNDIALVKLERPLQMTDEVHPACLPEFAEQEFTPTDDCWITGWGNTQGTGDSTKLQELKIAITEREACRTMWGASYILDTHVCIGDGETGACNGDSGGPLVCKRNDKWLLAGATSWGRSGCQTKGYPNVYTRISKYLDWLITNMTNN